MKERPIIFNADMVRAVLDGRKTQTRRIIQSPAKNMQAIGQKVIDYREPGDKWYGEHVFSMRNHSGTWCDYTKEQFLAKCPFGAVGDRLWVRETFAILGNEDGCAIDWNDNLIKGSGPDAARIYRASCEQKPGDYGLWSIPDDAPWKPHTKNMLYEGTWVPSIHMPRWASRITLEITGVRVERLQDISEQDAAAEGAATELSLIGDKHYLGYSSLWKSIYGDDSWQANPWVWVIEFKRMEVE